MLTACQPAVAGVCSSPTVNAAYAYDPLGRRTKKSGTGVKAGYFLSEGDDEVVDYDSQRNVLELYVPGPAIDEPVAMSFPTQNGDGTYSYTHKYFQTNHQGSVIAMSGDAGALSQGPFIYDAYGNCFKVATPCAQVANTVPYKFTGRRLDEETGLYYYRARCYSPTLGRFCQTDPVGYTADLNLYTYVGNDPVGRTDPTGNWGEGCNPFSKGCGGLGDIEGQDAATYIMHSSITDMTLVSAGPASATAAGLGGRTFTIPDVSHHPDVVGTPEQVSGAIDRFGTAPGTSTNEYSTDLLGGKWTDWARGTEDQSPFHPGATIELHLHTKSQISQNLTNQRYMPGPGDHVIPATYGAVEFYVTPDRNTVVEVGIRNGSFFATPVWQRGGTNNPFQSKYPDWQPVGRDPNE